MQILKLLYLQMRKVRSSCGQVKQIFYWFAELAFNVGTWNPFIIIPLKKLPN